MSRCNSLFQDKQEAVAREEAEKRVLAIRGSYEEMSETPRLIDEVTMESPTYKIGDTVWIAQCYSEQVFLTCPDCGGTKHIRCILHDGEEVSIECGACSRGYNPPTGTVGYYKRNPRTEVGVITGMNIEARGDHQEVEYTVQAEYTQRLKDDRLAMTREDALAKAEAIAAAENEQEQQKIKRKEKDTRSWAWNASYHRQKIKQAEKDIAYHIAKLNAATPHLKEEKAKAKIAKAKDEAA